MSDAASQPPPLTTNIFVGPADTPVIIDDGGSTRMKHLGGDLDGLMKDSPVHEVKRALVSIIVTQIPKGGATVETTYNLAQVGASFSIVSENSQLNGVVASNTKYVTLSFSDSATDVNSTRRGRRYVVPNAGRITSVMFAGTGSVTSDTTIFATYVRLVFST
jgi:hypothetical protein